MIPGDWKLALRNVATYRRALEDFLALYFPDFAWPPGGREEIAEEITRASEAIARRMVSGVLMTNARSWREAARKSLHGKRIFQALQTEASSAVLGLRLQALILRNAALIRSLPTDVAQMAVRFTAAEQRRGQRADAIAAKLRQKLPQMAQNRVQLIARTEVAKADTAVTQARAERLGLAWYDWTTSKDQRVRQAHAHLESVLVAWSDAPAPEQLVGERSKLGHYHAGGAPNCRCLALPLISLDEIKWPHKVYSHGHIELVSRTQFAKWIRIPEGA